MVVDVKKIEKHLDIYCKIKGKYSIDPLTGVVDLHGSLLHIHGKNDHIPVQFGTVTDDFLCLGGYLTTLKGAPHQVGGSFDCSHNYLIDLTHAPRRVDGSFICNSNKLTTLSGAPEYVGGDFNCSYNKLSTLSGAPLEIGGDFIVEYNSNLPLLRTLIASRLEVYRAPQAVKTILYKYEGTGRVGALKAAAELIRAGYQENAKW